jgi:hypothetical protein
MKVGAGAPLPLDPKVEGEEVLSFEEAVKKLELSQSSHPSRRMEQSIDHLFDALGQGFVTAVADGSVAKIREKDLKMVPRYNKAPKGYLTRWDAEKFLHTNRLPRKMKSYKVGRLRLFKMKDLEPYLPPEWITTKLRKDGEDATAMTVNKIWRLFKEAIKTVPLTETPLNHRRYAFKADLLKFFQEKLSPNEKPVAAS